MSLRIIITDTSKATLGHSDLYDGSNAWEPWEHLETSMSSSSLEKQGAGGQFAADGGLSKPGLGFSSLMLFW